MLVQRYNTSEISCCVKYTIFGFNVLFWIIGFALLAVGVWAHFEKNSAYSHLNKASKFYLDPAIFLIFAGKEQLFKYILDFVLPFHKLWF